GGNGQDTLDLSKLNSGRVAVDLEKNSIQRMHTNGNKTIRSFETVIGSASSGDQLQASNSGSTLIAYGGSDALYGKNGNDVLVASNGKFHFLNGGKGINQYIITPESSGTQIFDDSEFNQIFLTSVNSLDELELVMKYDAFTFRNKSSGEIIFQDIVSSNEVHLGENDMKTLIENFTMRFPMIKLSDKT
ncbi:hypothetical protein ACPV4X_26995, partial [Vibrio owensii]